jgi:predicted deacylase
VRRGLEDETTATRERFSTEPAREVIEGPAPGPHLLITGGVHGDEFEPMAAVRTLIARLKSGAPGLIRGRVTLVPVVNEAAFQRGERTADDGLDLARTCPGRADGSVTERVAHSLSALIRSADYYVDLHTGGTRLRVFPLAGYMLHRDPGVLHVQRRMARAFGMPIVWGTDPNLDGRSLSVARDARVPAIYAEYYGGGVFDPDGVDAYVRGCLAIMAEFKMIEAESWERPEQLVVEDDRPGAGHMQVNCPSPIEGFFEPAVALAQGVVAGDVLGTVTDPLGRRVEPVLSPYAGLVLVLHTFPRVSRGESVAVVLEMA